MGPSAVISDISGDAVLEIGLVPDDPGALFVQLMQDGVVGNEGVLAPLQTAPHPPAPFGQGVAAMFMLERACNLPAGKVTVV